MRIWIALALCAPLLASLGCSRAENESAGKRTPVAPPPVEVDVPADLTITVTVDGAARPPIDARVLSARAPDFRDDDRRAWKLTGLVPELERVGASVEARGKNGLSVRLERQAGSALEPVLFLTRRGELVATVLDPAQPFPDFHGQGGRLRRPGDTMPHVSPVLELVVRTQP